jgi:hypothetical protein
MRLARVGSGSSYNQRLLDSAPPPLSLQLPSSPTHPPTHLPAPTHPQPPTQAHPPIPPTASVPLSQYSVTSQQVGPALPPPTLRLAYAPPTLLGISTLRRALAGGAGSASFSAQVKVRITPVVVMVTVMVEQ